MDNPIVYDNENQSNLDIKKYLLKAVSYWYLFVFSILSAYIISHYMNKFAVPTYGLSSTVMIKEESNEDEVAGGLQLFTRRKNLQTQKGILKSYSLTLKAIKELDFDVSYFKYERMRSNHEIYRQTPFIVNFDTTYQQYEYLPVYITPIDSTKYKIFIEEFEFGKTLKFGEQFIYNNFNFNITLSPNTKYSSDIEGEKYFFIKNNEKSLVRDYSERLNVDVSPEQSAILWLWIIGTVPEKESNYLNKLIEVYIRQGLEEKNAKAESIIEFIDKQLEGVSDSLFNSETNLQIFKQQNNTMNISDEGSLLLENLNEINKLIKLQKNKLNYYEYIKKEIETNKDNSVIASPSVVDIEDVALVNYLTKYTEALTSKDILNINIKNETNFPISKENDIKISKIREQIYSHALKNIEVTKKQIQISQSELSDINFKINNLPISERKIINIQRKFDINDEIYTILLKRRMEAAITQASNKADTKELDPARPENATHKSPDSSGNKRKALIIGFIIPILIIVILEFFNNKIQDKHEIERGTSIPIIGTIGKNGQKSSIPVHTNPKSPISEAFRSVRTNLQYMLKDNSRKIIAVTSSISGEGKSFISSNLAAVIAISEKKTLLIGLDLRKPKLQNDFEYYKEKGISTFLIGINSFDEIIKPTEIANLDVALSGPVPPNPAELIESHKMTEFIEIAKSKYDYIIIDTPPVAVVTDALLLSEIADTYLYVMRQNYSGKNVLKLVNDLKKEANIKNISIVLNDVTYKKAYGYSYGYGYGYGYGFGQGYYDEDENYKTKRLYHKIKNFIKGN